MASFSRNYLPKIEDQTYEINLDQYKSIGTDWIALYFNDNNVTYFDSFGVENIPKEVRNSSAANIYWIQAKTFIMWGYFCNGFIDFIMKGKSLLDDTNLFSPNEQKKNNKKIVKHFQ